MHMHAQTPRQPAVRPPTALQRRGREEKKRRAQRGALYGQNRRRCRAVPWTSHLHDRWPIIRMKEKKKKKKKKLANVRCQACQHERFACLLNCLKNCIYIKGEKNEYDSRVMVACKVQFSISWGRSLTVVEETSETERERESKVHCTHNARAYWSK